MTGWRPASRASAGGSLDSQSGIETRNPGFNRLIEPIENVALSSKAPILLTSATGARSRNSPAESMN